MLFLIYEVNGALIFLHFYILSLYFYMLSSSEIYVVAKAFKSIIETLLKLKILFFIFRYLCYLFTILYYTCRYVLDFAMIDFSASILIIKKFVCILIIV